MKKLLLVGVALVALGPVPAAAQGVFDHLKCHAVKDPLKLKHSVDLDALQSDFSATGCKLTGKAKYFCVPVTKKNVSPAPPLPNVTGQTLQSDFTCYTLKCPNKPPDQEVTDQFGGPRHQSKYNTQLLCVPSYKGVKVVFTTSATTAGNFGGATAADGLCQQAAVNASLPGTFLAWLSDSSTSPSARFTQWTGPYVRTDGTVVANNWSDLTDGTLLNPIDHDESGSLIVPPPGFAPAVWTGTGPDGSPAGGSSCTNWTSPSESDNGVGGNADYFNNSGWTDLFGLGGFNCNVQAHFYCFEQ